MIALPEPEPPGLDEAAAPPSAQRIVQIGTGNIAVQVDGESSVTIVIGTRARLTLERLHALVRPVRSEVDLLRAEVAAVPLVGREEDLRRLEGWLEDAAPISVHAIVGGAGTGKTRLALELCRRAEDRGWRAGFVAPQELRRFAEQERIAAWDRDGPTLVIVATAARSARPLNAVLRSLAGQPPQEEKLRFLLLERHAEPEQGWWAEVRNVEGTSEDLLLDWFTGPLPESLAPVAVLEDRRAILAGTLAALRRHGLAPNVPELPPAGADPAFDKALAAPGADRAPLFLMLAALFAAEAGLATSLALGRLDLALWLAIRERDRLRALARDRGVNEELLFHLVALITLSRGLHMGDLPEVIGEERQALRLERGVALEDVGAALREALPARQEGGEERLSPLEPDIVGEAFCLLVLTRKGFDPPAQEALARRAGRRNLRRTAQELVLVARDFARASPPTKARTELERRHPEFARLPAWLGARNPALTWLRALAAGVESPLQLLEIADQVPLDSLILNELAAELEAQFVKGVRSLDDPVKQWVLAAPYARALDHLGNRLAALGRRQEAFAATDEAVRVYRELGTQRPGAFRADLARSLTNLGVRLAELGRPREALAAAEEALASYRALANERPGAFRPALAASLNNLGNRLAELGRREEALSAANEAVELCRALAKDRPELFRADLARSLTNLGHRLAELGRLEEALSAAKEAVGLCRALASERPDAFRPLLAGSLVNLGAKLGELDRYEEALAATDEAVGLYRALADERPEAFRPALAASLNNRGKFLNALGRPQEALAAAEGAVAIRRALAHEQPEAFAPELARSLSVRADCLEALGRLAEAVEADEEAVRTLAPFFFRSPRAFRDAVVLYSRDYMARCEKLGREPDRMLLTPIVGKLDELEAQRA